MGAKCCGPILSKSPKKDTSNRRSVAVDDNSKPLRPINTQEALSTAAEQHGMFKRIFCCKRAKKKTEPLLNKARDVIVKDHDGFRSPTLEGLSESKRALITEMRKRIDALPAKQRPPTKRHDLWLKRYLAHASWKIDKAMKLYIEFEEWRLFEGAETILKRLPHGQIPVLPGDFMQYIPWGTDRIGRTIYVMSVGWWPWWRQLFELHDDMIQAQIWLAEWMDHLAEKHAHETGEWRERSVILMDLSRLDRTYFMGLAGNSRVRARSHLTGKPASYYPGIIDKAYIINAPSFATKMFSVFKMVLSASLVEKANILSSAADRAKMLEDLGIENVPEVCGGNSKAPDNSLLPRHLQMPADGWKAWEEQKKKMLPTEQVIAAGATFEKILDIPKGGRAKWRWVLHDNSICFQVSQRNEDAKDFDVISEMAEVAFNGVEDPQVGSSPAPPGGGEIRLTWDNSSARYYGKTLLFQVEVVS